MRVGLTCPAGHLPVYSAATEREARVLVAAVCPLSATGHYVAPELAEEQTIENLARFSWRLHAAAERMRAKRAGSPGSES